MVSMALRATFWPCVFWGFHRPEMLGSVFGRRSVKVGPKAPLERRGSSCSASKGSSSLLPPSLPRCFFDIVRLPPSGSPSEWNYVAAPFSLTVLLRPSPPTPVGVPKRMGICCWPRLPHGVSSTFSASSRRDPLTSGIRLMHSFIVSVNDTVRPHRAEWQQN